MKTMLESILWTFDPPATTSILLATALALLLTHYLFRISPHTKLPPSPSYKLPFIGHLHILKADLRQPLRKLRKQLGDVYRLQLGNRTCIVVSGYSAVRDVLVTKGDAFLHRPYLPVLERVTRGTGMVNSNGKKWKEHRLFTMSFLKDFGMGQNAILRTIHEEIELLIDAMEAENGLPFNPKRLIQNNVANVICSLVFGGTFKHGDPKFTSLITIFEEVMKYAALSGIINFIPALGWFPLPGDPFKMAKLMEHSDNWFRYVEDIVAEHVDKLDENNNDGNDFVSAYIRHINKKDELGQPTALNIKELGSTIANLFAAGSQTITATLLWSLALLATHPDIQHKLYENIQHHVGTDRLPTTQDRKALVYVEAFYMEVMRYTNLTFTILRASSRDTYLHGYHIPADAMILVDMDSVLLDKATWVDPEVFRPARFMDESGRLRKVEEFVSFSLGKRKCIGEQLARTELLLFLSAIVQRFELVTPEGEDLSMATIDGDFSAVHAPRPFNIICRKR